MADTSPKVVVGGLAKVFGVTSRIRDLRGLMSSKKCETCSRWKGGTSRSLRGDVSLGVPEG